MGSPPFVIGWAVRCAFLCAWFRAAGVAGADGVCRVDGSGDACGDRGRCFLGACVCDAGVRGRFCEIADETAPSCGDAAAQERDLAACAEQIAQLGQRFRGTRGVRRAPAKGRRASNTNIGRTNAPGTPCRALLASVDRCAYRPAVGTVTVEASRWALAQKFEAETWRQLGHRGQDRDETHLRNYDNYVGLLPRRFERVLEVGCGPWTQSRTVLKKTGASWGSLTLSDPLLETYMAEVPSCSYASTAARAANFPNVGRVDYVAAGGEDLHAAGGAVQVDLATGAKSAPAFESGYDLAIMINVLEHCRDALATLQNLVNAVKPGGYLVLEDRYADSLWHRYDAGKSLRFPDRDVSKRRGEPFWDVGHPLQPKRAIFTVLARHFDVIHWRNNLFPEEQSPDEVYFIGRKRRSDDKATDLEWYAD